MGTSIIIIISLLVFTIILLSVYLIRVIYQIRKHVKFVHTELFDMSNGNLASLNIKKSKNKKVAEAIKGFEKIGVSIHKKYLITQQIVNNEKELDLEGLSNDDNFANTLIELHKNLREAKVNEDIRREEEKKQNWATKGEAMFGNILRDTTINLDDISFNIIQNLVDYTGAIQGALFINVSSENEDEIYELKASIAYDRRKMMENKFQIGESLVGRCAFEKLTIYLEDVPDDYVKVTSGLGEANPRTILLVPAKVNGDVLAVIELVSFNKFEPYQIEFVEKIGESVAATISNARINENTQRLLEQSKLQGEETAAQEEELRQNMEELQATQEEIERLRTQDQKNHDEMIQEVELHRKTLIKILDQIPGKIFLKDNNCRMVIVNKAVLAAHNSKPEDLLGKNDFDFISDANEAQIYYDAEQEIIKSGKPLRVVQKEIINNSGVYIDSLKMPFFIDYLGVTGILGFQRDVSEVVELREKVKELESKK